MLSVVWSKVGSSQRLAGLAIAALACVAAPGCSTSAQGPGGTRVPTAASGSGKDIQIMFSDKPVPAPDFPITDLDGKTIDRTQWRGKVVLLNFWATWCGPCRVEIPDLVALQERYREQLVVVGLSVDDDVPPATVKKFVQAQHVNYPVAMISELVEDQFGGIRTVPSTFVLNPEGRMVQRHRGLASAAQLEHEIRSLAGLPTAAQVQIVPDIGQILPANASR